MDLAPRPEDASGIPGDGLAEPGADPDVADVTLSSDDATELMLSLLLLLDVRKDSGLLEGPVTACAAAVATAAARSSECRQACRTTRNNCKHSMSHFAILNLYYVWKYAYAARVCGVRDMHPSDLWVSNAISN